MNMHTSQPIERSEIVLSARALCKNFGGIMATQNVDLDIFKGDRHALIGPNGAGKTTLINLLTGVLAPSSGKIELLGQDISKLAPHSRVQRGLVRTFQINQLFSSMSAFDTLTFVVSQTRGLTSQWWARLGQDKGVLEQVQQLLEQFHLTDVAHQASRSLSYGKQRLLEIAVALACQPKVLLLDEPVAGVPAGEREELLATVDQLPQDVSVLLIEHDMDLVFSFAKQMTVLVNGGVLCSGQPSDMAKDERVKEVYLGQGGVHGAFNG
jgi:branched-chain amino acid transport system ATP-binding protein